MPQSFLAFFNSTCSPVPISQRMASEREGLLRSVLRQRSMASLKPRPSRKLTTGSCPVAGRPRLFRNTTFEFDMLLYYEKNISAGIRYYEKKSVRILETGEGGLGCETDCATDDATVEPTQHLQIPKN